MYKRLLLISLTIAAQVNLVLFWQYLLFSNPNKAKFTKGLINIFCVDFVYLYLMYVMGEKLTGQQFLKKVNLI